MRNLPTRTWEISSAINGCASKLMPKAARKNKKAHKALRPTHGRPKGTLTRPAQVAWWLTADLEVCAVCGEGYAYSAGYHCSGCDAAVCAFCIEDRSGEFCCLEC